MYVYRTSGFNDKAERYGIQARIHALCAELETQRIDEVQAHFERVYPYLKRRILNRRIIARVFRVDGEQLLCLLDIFKRGDNDYQQFLESPREYGKTYLEPQLDTQSVRDWLVLTKNQQRRAESLPELPPELHPWLELPGWELQTLTEDWVIYESEEWVTRFRKREIQEAWETYYQMITEIRGGTIRSQAFPTLPNVKLCALNEHYVLYSQLESLDAIAGGVLFLLAPFEHEPSPTEIAQVGFITGLFALGLGTQADARQWEHEQTREDTERLMPTGSSFPPPSTLTDDPLAQPLNLSDLTPFAHRSYPAYLLADEESWLAIEQGNEANLALSTEEEQILKSVSTKTPGGSSLPLFINGRAGSGKSTMLLYLFADYCYRKYYDKRGRHRVNPLPGEPLFLTYNERSLEVTKAGVKTLLTSHHRFVAQGNQGDESDRVDHCFQPFQKFLLGLLPTQERSRFNPEKYISFHRFRQLYQGKNPNETLTKAVLHLPQARHYSPETCWYAIRNFIKGYGQQETMTPEDYQEEVPRKERTIELEKFRGIYETVWERWYKRVTQEQGYWDDQDLIAKVLELKCYRPEYTAIFCDEAQDFTRLELQLIMRLSLFSQYHLGDQPLQSLPFAFAGDPFQTLHPTGFRWSSVQATFDAEVITAIDPTEQLKLAINFQELTFNYRSRPPIVQVTNLIQLWRHVLFNIRELQPQTAWQQGNFPEPQKFILNQNISSEELAVYIKDTIIILPCEEGEEVAYTQADAVLSEIFLQSNQGAGESLQSLIQNPKSKIQNPPTVLKNILSAISAKGLEFKKVILYKFGEACQQNVWNLDSQGADQRVKVEYFFNKLYVAASRATEYLFVVDSEQGDRQLWQYASDEALLQAMLKYAKPSDRWAESVRTLNPGTTKSAQALREDDPMAIALEFETKGLNSQNPSLMRHAKQFYRVVDDSLKANLCEAWALQFEEQFQAAGSRFLQLGKSAEAWECFWQGLCWQELVTWYNQHPETQGKERSLASFMAAKRQDLEALNQFTAFVTEHSSEVSGSSTGVTAHQGQPSDRLHWKKAIAEYAHRIAALLNSPDLQPSQWQRLGAGLAALAAAKDNRLNQLAGECFLRAGNDEAAVRHWEASGATQTPTYRQAKARVVGMPEGLAALAEVGETDAIIHRWEQAGKPRDRHWLKVVAPALERKQQYQQAFVVYIWLDDMVKVKACFKQASRGTPTIKLFTILLQYFCRKNYWHEAIAALERVLPQVSGSERQKAALQFDVVYELACQDGSPQLTQEDRQRYAQFFREQILSTPDWQQHLSVQQVGIALEKLGLLAQTLRFYEQFTAHPDPEQRQFARDRWLSTKKKQEDEARRQGQQDQAAKLQAELLQNAQSWSIPGQSITLTPPTAPTERRRDKKVSQASSPPTDTATPPKGLRIQGLPTDTPVEQLDAGVIQFGVRHLVIKVMRESKQVLITDALNGREVRVDWAQSQVNIGDAVVESVGSHQLAFSLFASGYRGILYTDETPRLELTLQGLASKLLIEL